MLTKKDYDLPQIKKWIKQFHKAFNKYPNTFSGIVDAPDEFGSFTWDAVDKKLRYQHDISLADYIIKEFNAILKKKGKPLTEDVVLKWVETYFDEYSEYPNSNNRERIKYATADGYYDITWKVLNINLMTNINGLTYGKGLKDFIQERSRYPQYKFEEAKQAVIKLSIKNRRDYADRYKTDSRLPSTPDRTYKNEWHGWADFLGKVTFSAKVSFKMTANPS